MNMEIVVVAVAAVAVVVIVLSIYFALIKRSDVGIKIIIQNGTHVKGKKNSSGTEAYFKGNLKSSATVLVNNPSVWNIGFRKVENGEFQKFSFQKNLCIGRSRVSETDSMLVLTEDPLVSKQHCMIYESNGSLFLMDMDSKNHTFLNGKQIDTAVYLKNGDLLQVGNTRLEIHV